MTENSRPEPGKMTREALAARLKDSPPSVVGDLVYQWLLDRIVTLDIKPGAYLNESHLASQLGLSRTPIHRALEQLQADGLVQLRRGKNPVVSALDINEYDAIADLRAAVEGKAAFQAALFISQEDLARLKRIILDIDRHQDSAVPFPLNDTTFHEIVLRAARNPYFEKAYEIYRVKLMRYRWFIFLNNLPDEARLVSMESVHRGIYLALKNHFPQQAEELALLDTTLMRHTVLKF